MTGSSGSDLKAVLDLIKQSRNLLDQAAAQVEAIGGSHPTLDAATATRVARLGEVAHRHQEILDRDGKMILAQSREIRRELFGTGKLMRATANLFGKKGQKAILFRDRPYGTPARPNDPVKLTEEGRRIATLWREANPAA